ncbi:protein RMD9, mitochondrial [Suhomyces tanzawaensis NRRL Y-17324]|uniref:Protein RMD9, mitochondrial n=1 Tax=Suhomyces tanzawaensis NRRL Y-17324 TaxID=984487 RepID=A0A1E4SIK2_9ASCO|nr:protein RMD9, mitochondrial [Suhomyces tanzawaensis NRRL Y-17324]ODV79329.1 protein RMD9, mitochondrial [Suhomyces tanzawaensis NRRL Y-17324]
MFRLISSSQGLRPAILKVRANKPIALNTPSPITPPTSQFYPASFSRSNSSNSTNNAHLTKPSSQAKIDSFIKNARKDPLLKEVVQDGDNTKIIHFRELVTLATQQGRDKSPQSQKGFYATVLNLFELFDDEFMRKKLGKNDLSNYSRLLNMSVYHNRTSRLSNDRNRDKDQRFNSNYVDEMAMKSAVLHLSELIVGGEIKEALTTHALQMLFYAMAQYQFYPEMINLWENGVNDDVVGGLYLNQDILSVILPVAYNNGRFSYEEVLQVFELNTNPDKPVHHTLLTSIGKISISAEDYSRGLDALEDLLKAYESSRYDQQKVLKSLSDLHLSFIGQCKDIKISKHFFDKVIQFELPYDIRLKVPHVVSLLENCFNAQEPIENIMYFWISTIKHYSTEKQSYSLNSRYSNLNNSFFQIFFKLYPELTNESLAKLREIIAVYSESKPVDETFLNTIINNYNWADKAVFEQLIDNYGVYSVTRSPISYRIGLKKVGQLKDYTTQEILDKWNQSLALLDSQNYTYIPVADWAALRDATILSEYSHERKNLYLQILSLYKNYMQDRKSALRFLGNWTHKPEHYKDIARITLEDSPEFASDVDVVVPRFVRLKENVNYREITQEITHNRK